MTTLRVGVVGAGIVGLAHAWSAAERGHRVTVFERTDQACGASIRNFGMVWPIGQPPGELLQLALDSRARWLRFAEASGTWIDPCGSIHLAHRDDEWSVLEEFAGLSREAGYDCELLTSDQVRRLTPAANPAGLRGGLRSTTEVCVNPRAALPRLAKWLSERYGVAVHWGTHVGGVHGDDRTSVLATSRGVSGPYDRLVICGGADFQNLFPAVYDGAGIRLCKLQMMRTRPVDGWRLQTHLASGLTLRHYQNFEICDSLAKLKRRIAEEFPELNRYGIHVMASQNELGEVILGDSHEYDEAISPFDNPAIDDLILRELHKILRLPTWDIAARWHGVYAKLPGRPVFEASPQPGVHVCTATGGAGMTMSFGLAERAWRTWSAE